MRLNPHNLKSKAYEKSNNNLSFGRYTPCGRYDYGDAKTTKKNYKKSTSRNSISRQRNGIINGHTAIDLGLSVRWATENINANTSYQTGNWFAWRDYDIAKKEWGASWRMPTISEWNELINKCRWIWTGNGYEITGPNGNFIYLPTTGRIIDNGQHVCSNLGFYWTKENVGNGSDAFAFRMWNGGKDFIQQNYYWCIPVRPVIR